MVIYVNFADKFISYANQTNKEQPADVHEDVMESL